MADAQDTSSSTSNIIPFRPRERSAVAAQPEDHVPPLDGGETVLMIWRRAGLGDTIRPLDIIEVEFSPKVGHDGVYLIQIGSMPELRRVQIMNDGRARVSVDGSFAETVEREALHVVGEVTRHWRAA